MSVFTVLKAAVHVTKMAAVETNEMAEKALQARRLGDLIPKSRRKRKISIEVIEYEGRGPRTFTHDVYKTSAKASVSIVQSGFDAPIKEENQPPRFVSEGNMMDHYKAKRKHEHPEEYIEYCEHISKKAKKTKSTFSVAAVRSSKPARKEVSTQQIERKSTFNIAAVRASKVA